MFICPKCKNALTVFTSANTFIETVFKDEVCLPSVHIRDSGDLYDLIAITYMKLGNMDKAIEWLRKMVDYELVTRSKYTDDMKLKTPLLGAATFLNYYRNFKSRNGYLDSLLEKLGNSAYDKLKDNEEYKALIGRVSDERSKENT